MYLKMKTIREECGGCPTHFTGETTSGQQVDMYLRNSLMKIEVDGVKLSHAVSTEFDGVCSLDDFKRQARRNGHILDTSGAEWSSAMQDLEETIQQLYADSIWVTFIRDFYSKSVEKTFKKDQSYTVSLELAPTLLKSGLVVIASEHDQAKLDAHWGAKNAE